MKLLPGITLAPILHGRAAFSTYIRELCNKEKYDCIAVDLPEPFKEEVCDAVNELPYISATTATSKTESGPPLYYIPTDPCDATIEGIRQAQQKRIPCHFIGYPELYRPKPLPPLPDEYAIKTMGFNEYSTLCIHALSKLKHDAEINRTSQYIAYKLHELRIYYKNILAIVHFRHIIQTIHHIKQERTYNLSFPQMRNYTVETYTINPDHLYFAIGELPFITGLFEKERHDLFAEQIDITDTIKDLFCKTRNEYFDNTEDIMELSPVRIQNALTFLRNLTVMEKRLVPSLFDIVTAAKGIGGNAFAVRILKSAKYYPYLPIEQKRPSISIGINKVHRSGKDIPESAVNLFKDTEVVWRTLSIKPDPSEMRKKKYRFFWNPLGMCSHLPEDRRVENFNSYIRTKALRVLCEDFVKTERFEASVKDGIDIRETLRNWVSGDIYIKEIPPSRGSVDTVVIIFDDANDDKYPHRATWYAEHEEESTLTFYGTDPFDDMIGPGVARCCYGGLSLLFPPRNIPSAFELTEDSPLKKLSHRLVFGALLFTRERSVAYVSAKKPDIYLRRLASKMKKRLIWIPIASFSSETLRRLRRFHILNGKQVRSWASRFIGE